jgi:hypothetical protein
MPQPPPLTRYLGKAERTLQSLLQIQLRKAELSFPEWTVLTFLSGSGALAEGQLAGALENGRIVDRDEVPALIRAMSERRLIGEADASYSITTAGLELYLPLRQAVEDHRRTH